MSDKLHIAIYMPSLRGGGAERSMVTLANGFAVRGHRVDLVLTKAEGPYLADVSQDVRIVDLDRGRVLASLLPLVKYLRLERPDTMLSAMDHVNIIALLARKLAQINMRLVISTRSAPSAGMLQKRAFSAAMRGAIARLYPSADAIVCVSHEMRNEMKQFFGLAEEKLHTIYNPLDMDRIERMMDEPVAHHWLRGGDVPVVLAAGRLTAAKDYPTLLRAFAKLRLERPARLIILGQGADETALVALASKLAIDRDVAFVGFQRNPFCWMRACDVYVMSSAWEGLPGTLLEALACGARVVSTDCRTGPKEILEDGRWGRLVPVGDASALAEAITAALDDKNPPKSRIRAYDFRADRALELYGQLLGVGRKIEYPPREASV